MEKKELSPISKTKNYYYHSSDSYQQNKTTFFENYPDIKSRYAIQQEISSENFHQSEEQNLAKLSRLLSCESNSTMIKMNGNELIVNTDSILEGYCDYLEECFEILSEMAVSEHQEPKIRFADKIYDYKYAALKKEHLSSKEVILERLIANHDIFEVVSEIGKCGESSYWKRIEKLLATEKTRVVKKSCSNYDVRCCNKCLICEINSDDQLSNFVYEQSIPPSKNHLRKECTRPEVIKCLQCENCISFNLVENFSVPHKEVSSFRDFFVLSNLDFDSSFQSTFEKFSRSLPIISEILLQRHQSLFKYACENKMISNFSFNRNVEKFIEENHSLPPGDFENFKKIVKKKSSEMIRKVALSLPSFQSYRPKKNSSKIFEKVFLNFLSIQIGHEISLNTNRTQLIVECESIFDKKKAKEQLKKLSALINLSLKNNNFEDDCQNKEFEYEFSLLARNCKSQVCSFEDLIRSIEEQTTPYNFELSEMPLNNLLKISTKENENRISQAVQCLRELDQLMSHLLKVFVNKELIKMIRTWSFDIFNCGITPPDMLKIIEQIFNLISEKRWDINLNSKLSKATSYKPSLEKIRRISNYFKDISNDSLNGESNGSFLWSSVYNFIGKASNQGVLRYYHFLVKRLSALRSLHISELLYDIEEKNSIANIEAKNFKNQCFVHEFIADSCLEEFTSKCP